MEKYNLFLDDVRDVREAWRNTHKPEYLKPDWVTVRSYNEFIEMIETLYNHNEQEFPGLISFDHDLADVHYDPKTWTASIKTQDQEKTGYDCAKWLVDFCMDKNLDLPEYMIHSQNPVGGENIQKLLENYKKFKHENQSV